MKNLKRLISAALAMIIAMSSFFAFTSFAQAESITVENEVVKEILYENSFDTGSNADLPEVEHNDFYYPGYNSAFKTAVNNYEYAASNAPANYSVTMRALSKAEVDGNTGVRLAQSVGVGNGPIILFDFRYQDAAKTPSRTPEGLRSGKYTLSFDFSLQGDVYNADGTVRILANCFHGNTASNLAHFDNTNWSILAGSNSWTYPANSSFKNMELDADEVYSYDMVLDLDNHKVQHYIEGEFKGEITGYKSTIKFLMIVMNGDFDYLDNVKLEKEITYPVEYDITSDKTGNNFYGDEEMNFTVTATNREDSDLLENVVIKATNPQEEEEAVLLEKELLIPGNSSVSFDFAPDLDEYGSWNLSIESERSRAVTTRVARVVEVDELNPEVAICFHMDGRHTTCDIHEGFELMEKAGISAARTDYGISVTTKEVTNEAGETIKVPVEILPPSGTWYENVVAESKEHGIDILPILYISKHGCYGSDADGGYNTTDEALELMYEAAKKFAQSTKGQFKWFELGNEDNYFWKPATQDSKTIALSNKNAILNLGYIYETPGIWNKKYPAENYTITVENGLVTVVKNATGEVIYDKVLAYEPESGADYAKVLKAGYDGIKAGNPDAVVMNSGSSVVYIDDGGTIRNQYEFAEGLLGTIQADYENKYYDVFAVHSYHSGSAPEEGDKWKRYMDFMEQQNVLTELLEDYGQISINSETGEIEKDVERWATEIGYSSSAAEERHYAAWMARLLALNFMGDEYGPYHDKFFIYALFNHGFDKAADSENTYGIVNNWADEYWYKKSAYSAKEPYLVVAQWNKMMNGLIYNEAGSYINHTSDNQYDSDGDEILTAGLFNLEFSNKDKRVNVVWDASGNNEVTTVTADGIKKITVYDMYGNIEKETLAASIDITATEEPVYVEFTEADLFEISSLRITSDTDGTEADWTALSSASKLYAEVKYKNTSSNERTFNLVSGVYDDKRLVKVLEKKVSVAASDRLEEVTEYLEIPLDKTSKLTVKAFVFENLNTLKPLCESVSVSEKDETVLYCNTFPTGTNADLPEVEHKLYYFYGRNANLKYALNAGMEYIHNSDTATNTHTYYMALDDLLTSEFNGDIGVRVRPGCSLAAGPVVMLDFRYSDSDKKPTADGALKSGVYKFGFDFVLDGSVLLTDGFRVEANCKHGNCGNSFAWMMSDAWHNLSGGNTWSYTEKNIPITNEELHHYEIIFDLDSNKVITYMDGVRRKDTAYSGNINFLHLTIGGKMKYVDNVEFTKIEK